MAKTWPQEGQNIWSLLCAIILSLHCFSVKIWTIEKSRSIDTVKMAKNFSYMAQRWAWHSPPNLCKIHCKKQGQISQNVNKPLLEEVWKKYKGTLFSKLMGYLKTFLQLTWNPLKCLENICIFKFWQTSPWKKYHFQTTFEYFNCQYDLQKTISKPLYI